MSSSAVAECPCFRTTQASGRSPSTSCGKPITATSSIAGWDIICFSMFVGPTCIIPLKKKVLKLSLRNLCYLRGQCGTWLALYNGQSQRGFLPSQNSLDLQFDNIHLEVFRPFPRFIYNIHNNKYRRKLMMMQRNNSLLAYSNIRSWKTESIQNNEIIF